jgi:hypothetical protein
LQILSTRINYLTAIIWCPFGEFGGEKMYNPSQPQYGNYNPQYGNTPIPEMGGQTQDPIREQKRKWAKSSKIGIALFLGAFGAYIVGIPTVIVCIGILLILGAFGLGIAGYVMMIRGGNAFPKPHKALVIASLIILISGVIIALILSLAFTDTASSSVWGAGLDGTYSGEEIIDTWDSQQSGLWVGMVTAVFFTAAWAMLFFVPSKKWGKILIVVYVVISLSLSGAGILMKNSFIDEAKGDIDPDKEYSLDEYNELNMDLSIKSLVAGLLGLISLIILIIIAIGAFINVKKMEEELKPKLDNRLYDLKI